MIELINKVSELKEELEKETSIKRVRELNKEIINDKELMNLIRKYHDTNDERIKKKIYSNKLIREYKEKETDINLIIMGINNSLKKISNRGKCGYENN